ncbi:DNA polymerase III subunit gamma/tau [Candidatus Uhrbacteria bacterium]|nr:DNA polymerase III subunit gamma/tau [Candidatus Uhrbacteria bacterium]
MSLALYRAYRPQKFEDLIGQPHVSTTIQNQFEMGRIAHAYLFTGPRGVGKTTTARLLAKLVNCEKPKHNEPCNTCAACEQVTSGSSLDIYEIDAASNTDVENVRENIIKSVRFAPNQLKMKVFIIDEVHMLSTSAFNALLKTLEEPPAHVIFILATTEIHKVPETIISRCQRFDFKRIQKEEMIKRLKEIAKSEEVKVDDEVLDQVVRHSAGCARDAESLLGQLMALGEKHITIELASLVLPATTTVLVDTFLNHLFEKDTQACISDLNTFIEQGVDLRMFVEDVISNLRDRLFDQLSKSVSESDISFTRQALTSLLEAKTKIRSEHLPQLPIELTIVELCGSVSKKDFNEQGVDSVSTILSLRVSEAISTDETVFDTIPVISLDEVRAKWPQVFEQIKECNASLPLFMQSCEVCGVTGEHVELGFAYDLYVQTVNKDKNRQVIEDVLEKVIGRRIKVKAIQTKHENEEDLQKLVSEFGGTLMT